MTTIDGKQFWCPHCGGDTIRENMEAIVTCEIVRFLLDEDGDAYPDEEGAFGIRDFIAETQQYECAECGRHFDIRELPALVVASAAEVKNRGKKE